MVAGAVAEVFLVDAVINDIPLVGTGDVDDGIVCCAVDLVVRVLCYYYWLLCHADGASWRGACSVGHVIIWRAGVVDAPEEIVLSVAVEHVHSLAEGIVIKCASLWGDGIFRSTYREHVVGEQAVVQLPITII